MNAETIQVLKEGFKALPAKDHDFAQSLVHQFESKGTLSSKQQYWVEKLVDEIEMAGVPDFTADMNLDPQGDEKVGGLVSIFELFAKAQAHLKFPELRLQLDSGQDVVLRIAGSKSKYEGTLQVVEKVLSCNNWLGYVDKQGVFNPAKNVERKTKTSILALLTTLAQDPAGTAAKYGKMTGKCCFCKSQLTDPKSTEVGYGPVCAQRWGMPWGKGSLTLPKAKACN